MQFSFDAAYGTGWKTFKSKYGTLLGGTLIFILVIFGASIVQNTINQMMGLPTKAGTHQTFPDLLVTIFFTNIFSVGIVLFALALVRGESPPLSTLFHGFKRYWPLVGIGVLTTLIFGAIIMLTALIAGFQVLLTGAQTGFDMNAVHLGGMTLITVLISVCIMAFFFVRLMFVGLLCVDPKHQLGVMDSFATSWKITGPVFWPLLGIFIVMLLILIASILLLVLPLFFVGIPLMMVVLASAYALLIDEPASAVEEPEAA